MLADFLMILTAWLLIGTLAALAAMALLKWLRFDPLGRCEPSDEEPETVAVRFATWDFDLSMNGQAIPVDEIERERAWRGLRHG